jgi:hypothetical protein
VRLDDRKLWLQLLEGSFTLIYKDAAQKIPPLPYGDRGSAEKMPWNDDQVE